MALPKPLFTSCDETSIKLTVPEISLSSTQELRLQYKEPPVEWEQAQEVTINDDSVLIADLIDLKPGMAYFVRLAVVNKETGEKQYGPESVYDTKPVDCGPKKKKCIIS